MELRKLPGAAMRNRSLVRRLEVMLMVIVVTACVGPGNRGLAGERTVPRRLTRDGHFKQRPMWSPDGKQVLFSRHRGGKIGLVSLAADGSAETLLADGKVPCYDACWSPDGDRIAFTRVAQSPGQGNLDVYLARRDGTDPQKLAGDQGKLSHEEYPAWSPDGTRIAYSSTFEGNQEIYVWGIEQGRPLRVTSDPAIDAHPAWTPDSRQIVFATNRWGDFEIALSDADGRNLVRLTESSGLDDYPVFAPNGKCVAFLSNRDGNYEIYLLRLSDRSVVNLTRDPAIDMYPAWTPDGRLAFVSNRDDEFDIYVMEVE